MEETTNYELKKIELTDSPPDITVLNSNWDTIDAKLKEASDHIEESDTHMEDGAIHVTSEEKSNWNGKAAGDHSHDTAYAPISHSNNTNIHVTATDKSNWNGKADEDHNHSASDITGGTLPITRGGTGQTQRWTSLTFSKSNTKFGSFWGSIQYYRYLDMVYFNMGISVTSTVTSGSVTVGVVSNTYKPAVRTQLASSLSQGHAYIDTDGRLKLYSGISLDAGTSVYFTGWYYAGD